MEIINLIIPFADKFTQDLSPARIVESLVLYTFLWNKLSPHLVKIEERLRGLEYAVTDGFNSGEERFKVIEMRIIALEEKGGNYGKGIKQGS